MDRLARLAEDRAALIARAPRFAAVEARAGPLPWRTRAAGFAGLPRGLGPWTAQAHLPFSERRRDFFPGGDIASANSARDLFALDARSAPRALAAMAEARAPGPRATTGATDARWT